VFLKPGKEQEDFIMARLSYPDPTQLSGVTRQVLAQLPVPLHLFQMLAYSPSALAPTLLLGKAILGEQELPAHLRELAILQVAKQAKADYEWIQHVPIAKAAGVTDEHIALVEKGSLDAPVFDQQMRLVLHVAQEVVTGPYISDETFAALQASFPPRQIVELVLSIGYYLMLGRFLTALQIDLDPPSGNAVVETAKRGPSYARTST
jgi:4-carboxymuconolactone decarboxylase